MARVPGEGMASRGVRCVWGEPGMEPVIQHFQEHYGVYIAIVVCALPFIIIFRRYAVPLLTYLMECALYCALLHGFFWVLVFLARKFKTASAPYWKRVDPGWETPILHFWRFNQYDPRWVAYVEVVLAALICYFVLRYRPLVTQKSKAGKPPPKKGRRTGASRLGRR